MTDSRQHGEHSIISLIRGMAKPGPGVRVGIGDDAAVLETEPAADLLFCSDLCIEGIHFKLDWYTPRLAGRKALARTISDIAAMGGVPRYALISVALPRGAGDYLISGLFAGMTELANDLGVSIVGGDTAASPGPLVMDVSVLGSCGPGKALTRAGAVPGDAIFVTGELGASAIGLCLLKAGLRPQEGDSSPQMERSATRSVEDRAILSHLFVTPRVAAGRGISELGAATAMIDISDGLAGDLTRILQESNCGAVIERARLPLPEWAAGLQSAGHPIDTLECALAGGEDYELLFTAPLKEQSNIRELARSLGARITRIGEITSSPGLFLEQAGERRALTEPGFEHQF